MDKFLPIGERVKAERERLQMTQQQLADVAGITRKTVFGYESGARAPDGGALAAWAQRGMDVLYVITGQRAGQAEPLTEREERLLNNYRASDDSGKRAVEGAASAVSQPADRARQA